MALSEDAPVTVNDPPAQQLAPAPVLEPVRSQSSGFTPPRPRSLAQTGLTANLISDMILKLMHFSTQLPAHEIATRLRLDYECIHQVISALGNGAYIQSIGQAPRTTQRLESLEEGLAYMITDQGRERAREILDRNQYMGPAPVPLHDYNDAVRRPGSPENFARGEGL